MTESDPYRFFEPTKTQWDHLIEIVKKRTFERDELKRKFEALDALYDTGLAMNARLVSEITAMKAENARLREGLTMIALSTACASDCAESARKALGGDNER